MIEIENFQPAGFMDALRREVTETAVMVELDFADEPFRYCNRTIPFTDGQGGQWKAGADLLVSIPTLEGGDALSTVANLAVGGLFNDAQSLSDAINIAVSAIENRPNYSGRKAVIWQHEFIDGVPFGNPYALATGLMDRMNLNVDNQGIAISVSVEFGLARKKIPFSGYLTHSSQQRLFSSDMGLEFAASSGKFIKFGWK